MAHTRVYSSLCAAVKPDPAVQRRATAGREHASHNPRQPNRQPSPHVGGSTAPPALLLLLAAILRLLAPPLLRRGRALPLLEQPRRLLLLRLGNLRRLRRLVERRRAAAAAIPAAARGLLPRLRLRLRLRLVVLGLRLPPPLGCERRLLLQLQLLLLLRRGGAAPPTARARARAAALLQLAHLLANLRLHPLQLLKLRAAHCAPLRLQLRGDLLLQPLQLRHLRHLSARTAAPAAAATAAADRQRGVPPLLRLLLARDLPRVVNDVVLTIAVQVLRGSRSMAARGRARERAPR